MFRFKYVVFFLCASSVFALEMDHKFKVGIAVASAITSALWLSGGIMSFFSKDEVAPVEHMYPRSEFEGGGALQFAAVPLTIAAAASLACTTTAVVPLMAAAAGLGLMGTALTNSAFFTAHGSRFSMPGCQVTCTDGDVTTVDPQFPDRGHNGIMFSSVVLSWLASAGTLALVVLSYAEQIRRLRTGDAADPTKVVAGK